MICPDGYDTGRSREQSSVTNTCASTLSSTSNRGVFSITALYVRWYGWRLSSGRPEKGHSPSAPRLAIALVIRSAAGE